MEREQNIYIYYLRNLNLNKFYTKIKLMNVAELSQRLQVLQEQNGRLRQMVSTTRNSRSQQPIQGGQVYRVNMTSQQQHRNSVVDFQTKYKKALKQIYEVIQANRSLKEELDKFKSERSRIDGSMSEMRKEEVYKAYENVLQEKNTLSDKLGQVQSENESHQMEIESLQAQVRVLKEENLQLLQEKEGLESNKHQQSSSPISDLKSEQVQQYQQRMRLKQQQFHRTIQNYQQHHITLSNQNKRNQQRLSQLQQKLIESDKQWRQRYQSKQIQSKEIKNKVRHEYQEQINILRKQVNSLKALNTELMTKLQTNELEGNKDEGMTDYEVQFLSNIKELRLQMEPLKKQIIQLQEQNHFDKEQLQRQKTQLQLKLYQHESTIQHYSITIKNQQQKIIKLNQIHKKNQLNQAAIKKLQQQNRILGGRVIVLESKDIALQSRKNDSYRGIEQNVLEFQTRVEMLLDQKENLANIQNITIHQLVALKAYIAQLDQKLKIACSENQYAIKKYKSYKQKYLSTVKQMKSHQLTQNTLKSKILGYDKLVQRLQSQLQKTVNIGEMQTIQITTKTTQEQIQLQTFKKKYQSLKQKLILQEKYNKQELETIKLNYQTKIVDLTIKVDDVEGLRQAIQLYKDKNEELQAVLVKKDNEIVELRMVMTRPTQVKSQADLQAVTQNREFILSLQQTIRKQQAHIAKCQAQLRMQEDSSRKRIITLQKQLHQSQLQINKSKMSTTSTRYSTDRSPQQLLSETKRLKNRISQLQNELILTKGRRLAEQSSRNSYQLQFKASSLQIEKNELVNRLETELANRRRLEKQVNELMMRGGQLEAEMTQLNVQSNRKQQELAFVVSQKLAIIQNLQEQLKRIKSLQQQQRKSSIQLLPHMVTSGIIPSSAIRQDHTLCENKVSRLQRQLQGLRQESEQLKKKLSENVVVPFNYQLQSIKHQKQELRLRNQRLEKQMFAIKSTITMLEQQRQDSTRVTNTLKQQMSSLKLTHQDQLFDKERLLTQLRTKLQHSQSTHNTYLQLQQQLQRTVNQKQRQISSLKIKLNNFQSDYERMSDAINKYNREINTIKYNYQSEHAVYAEQMDSLLQQKGKTLKKYEQQIASLYHQIDELSQQLLTKAEALVKTQRELSQLQLLQDQLSRVNSSLSDRENVIAKNRYELSVYEEENERIKKEMTVVKEELQRQRLEVLQKDDQISSVRMQMANLTSRLSNQLKNQFVQQLTEKDHQLTRAAFQLQSLQTNYNNIQQQLNQVQFRERKVQQQLSYTKSQLAHTQEEMNSLSERLMKKQTQVSQITSEMTGLRFLEEEIVEKNNIVSKLRGELSTMKIELSQLNDELEYNKTTIQRQSNDLRAARQDLLSRQQTINRKDTQMRNMQLQAQRLKSAIDDNQTTISQRDSMITKLNSEITKMKSQKQQLQDEIEEREQEWSNVQYELGQSKSKIALLADQLQGKDITIAKLTNQSVFLKQQITRLNQEVISKSHQINRVSQQVFVQKMQYTNKTSQEVDRLSNELFSMKRELQVARNAVEDLQGENRRLRIEMEASRVREMQQQQYKQGMQYNSQLDELRLANSTQYRQIMQLELQLSQRNSQIQLLQDKVSKLQLLLHQVQQDNHYNRQHLQSQIQQFIDHQRQLRSKIEYLQTSSNTTTHTMTGEEQNTDELKFGLKLYTEETDRLKMIIDQLTEEVTQLKLKLTVYVNQQDRISENLVTMALTFAQIQSLRDRVKSKQVEINTVRRSFIQAISSNQDLISSQKRLQSLSALANKNIQQDIHTLDLLEQNNREQMNKEANSFEVRSDQGSIELPQEQLDKDYIKELSAERQQQHQHIQAAHVQQNIEQQPAQVNLPEPVQFKQLGSQNAIQYLNQMKQTASGFEQQQHVSFNPQIIQQPQARSQEVVQVHRQQQIITTQQHQHRGRTINIVYQGSQVQSSSAIESQRLVHSQYQSPSGKTYVRITQQQQVIGGVPITNSGPGLYIPQAMNIQPIRQSGVSFTNQGRPVSNSLQTQPHLRY